MALDPQNTPLPTDTYVSFDASSMKQMMIRNLTDAGVLTDQQYEGSNISAIINTMAIAYQSLLFYLNKTASETNFSTAQIYENMNRIVKLIGYNPLGYQTATLSFNANLQQAGGNSLTPGIYTIPRFSYFRLNNIVYSFADDSIFSVTDTFDTIGTMASQTLLYQGKFVEYPIYTATGEGSETYSLSLPTSTIVDHFTIKVYVKDITTNVWSEWTKTESLSLEDGNAKKYSIRLNESKIYELRFGNGIFGKGLNQGDIVQTYYLQSDGEDGVVGIGNLDGKPLVLFSTPNYDSILANTTPSISYRYVTDFEIPYLNFTNTIGSTDITEWETVDEIRTNAPGNFRTQNRVVTADDFETIIRAKTANFIKDTTVVNNRDYINGIMRYYYDLGLSYPHTESRILFNHVQFADACDFNNVYVFGLPKATGSLTPYNNFLTTAQKQFIIDELEPLKLTSAEIVPSDPVYIEASIEANTPNTLEVEELGNSFIQITKDASQNVPDSTLKEEISQIILDAFSISSSTLGSSIEVSSINNSINSLRGIKNVSTIRIVNGVTTESNSGITFMLLNPVYPLADQNIVSGNITLDFFKNVYLKYSTEDLINKITIK